MNIEIIIKDIEVDGLPTNDGAVGFIFDHDLFVGWPITNRESQNECEVIWETSFGRQVTGIRYWFCLPEELRSLR